jgi:hypothetical protein
MKDGLVAAPVRRRPSVTPDSPASVSGSTLSADWRGLGDQPRASNAPSGRRDRHATPQGRSYRWSSVLTVDRWSPSRGDHIVAAPPNRMSSAVSTALT